MKRRDFLRNMTFMPIIARSFMTGGTMLANMENAYADNGKTLIVIFQRGGCDGLNVVIPYGEDDYYNLRPDIAIASPGSSPDSAFDLNGFFGLHPSMTGLHDIYQQGDLAIMPTVHYSNANRSHFSSQDYIESGVANQRLTDGWLNRYLSSYQQPNDLQALSFSSLAHSLQGKNPVTTINTLSSINGNHSLQTALQNIYNLQINNETRARSLVRRQGKIASENISILANSFSQNYKTEHNAAYPDTQYGQQLKDIAQLIKAGVEIGVATVSNNGWDHHANQGGANGEQASKLQDFSDGIHALYTDLGASYLNNVTILTISEFGRTAKQNASLGTDHGNASTWFVIGNQVNGGIYGDWPGLTHDQLYLNRYLSHTIDFTDVYAELLIKHLGTATDLSAILPGSQYQPIGFL